ncbi:S9 family peptidase [Sphingobacterium suaedae]|uniref:DPP IV N-terminal domain-containing protein n=1 Tax=Sphingobacterium suaedae TaxID=1686402 RepID=A0ABW5KGQ8_9SPHI
MYKINHLAKEITLSVALVVSSFAVLAQRQWTSDGNGYYNFSNKEITVTNVLRPGESRPFLNKADLVPTGTNTPLDVQSFQVSPTNGSLLLFTNTKRVWRENTRGDYWLFNKATRKLTQLGEGLPTSSLMFAKFSPNGQQVAYVCKHNLYVEDLSTHQITLLTSDGGNKIINGTFDWAYEEEFGTKDGFRWSPDGTKIAFWKQDVSSTRNFLMINNTDSLYSFTVPVEYPKVGLPPSATSVWIVDVGSKNTIKVKLDGDESQHYIPRMEWLLDGKGVILQRLNRKQNESLIWIANAANGMGSIIHEERDVAWIDIKSRWNNNDPSGWDWVDNGKEFLWLSEKGGWRQLYAIDLTGKERLISKDTFDIISLALFDTQRNNVYFYASPSNATQKYLYKIDLKGGRSTRVTPASFAGTNTYDISPNGRVAIFKHNSTIAQYDDAIVSLPNHEELVPFARQKNADPSDAKTEFFQVTTVDGITLDGWMVKPKNFDPSKKYPVVFYVYGEPASQTVTDNFYTGKNFLYVGDMAADGYVYVSLENRGTPAPKGRMWRKSIYRNIGRLNIRDQAMGAKEVFKFGFIDTTRVAVWGWSGGGASTLNLLGQYPNIYQTGISIAPVTNQLLYDNIYQERYMGLPQENEEDFINGSAITYAKYITGNLLLIHGTGDDNVHYQNAEIYINELIRHRIAFQLMSYPNRSHSISEGEGTTEHLQKTYTKFLQENCPPGGR